MFDALTAERLKFYVYALIDPRNDRIFYIGKGTQNRVFDHAGAVSKHDELMSTGRKIELIHEIIDAGYSVKHLILRHGLTEDQAFLVEASLIDFANIEGQDLTNEVVGKGSIKFGAMSAQEIMQTYNAPPLEKLHHNAVIININKTYERASGGTDVYNATKEAWVISAARRNSLQLVLSEYRGVIVEVFEIHSWYQCKADVGKPERWGFQGSVASEKTRKLYINKSIQHRKKRGAANPIRYSV